MGDLLPVKMSMKKSIDVRHITSDCICFISILMIQKLGKGKRCSFFEYGLKNKTFCF